MSGRHPLSVSPVAGPVGRGARHSGTLPRWTLAVVLAAGSVVGTSTRPALAAPLNDCVASDNGDPVVTSVQVTPDPIDVTRAGRTVRFRLQVEDRGGPGPASGLSKVWLGFGGTPTPEGGNFVLPYAQIRLVRDAGGAWVGSILVPRGTRPGRVPLGVLLEDNAHNVSLDNASDLEAAGLLSRITVQSRRDRRAPHLTSLRIRPRVVDTHTGPVTVTVTATARDRRAGVHGIGVEGLGNLPLVKVPGKPGTFRGTRTFRPWARPGVRRVRFVWFEDRVGNASAEEYETLDRAGFDRELTVVSRRDTRPPTLTRLTLTPSAVDVRTADQTVTVRVRARDRQAGLHRVSAVFWPSGEGVDLRMTSGTARRGVWEASLRMPRCALWGHWERARISLTDRAGRERSYETRELARRGWDSRIEVTQADHLPPAAVASYHQSTPATPITVSFDESVNGITPDSALVRPWLGEGVFGQRVSGTWACRDATNASADCVTGVIRSATFRPARTLAPVQHVVTLNPEFSLAITDLAGNPFRRELVFLECASPSQPGCAK